jgi:5'-nucleotidase
MRRAMKRLLAPLLFLLVACSSAPAPRPPVHVVIVGTTDVHGWYNGHTEVPRVGGEGIRWGGLPLFASYVNALREQNPGRVLVVDSGDMFQGTLESNLNEGEAVIRGYNAIGYTAAAVGNHEFDFGPLGPLPSPRTASDDPLGALKRNARLARFPYLAANITEKATGRTPSWMRRYVMATAGGAKIGIIGLATPDTPAVTLAVNVQGLDFGDPVAAAIECARELREQGADAIIVVAHIGGRCTDLSDEHDLASCDRQQEALRYLEAIPRGTIDAWFAGHSHAQMRHFVNGVAALQGLAYSREFSVLDLYIDRAANRVVPEKTAIRALTMICPEVYSGTEQCDPRTATAESKLVPRHYEGRTIAPNVQVATVLAPFLDQVAAKREEKLNIRTASRFTRSYLFESPLGNLIADALREAIGADFALMNAGGIRAELREGDLTYSDLFEVSPFDNYPTVVKLTGAEIAELLNLTSTGERGIMQVSGLHYTYDAAIDKDKPFPQRRRLVSVTLPNGQPLDPQREYSVVMPDFIAGGGDGSEPLMSRIPRDRVNVMQKQSIRDLVIEVLAKRGTPLQPLMEGRVRALNDPRAPAVPGR